MVINQNSLENKERKFNIFIQKSLKIKKKSSKVCVYYHLNWVLGEMNNVAEENKSDHSFTSVEDDGEAS